MNTARPRFNNSSSENGTELGRCFVHPLEEAEVLVPSECVELVKADEETRPLSCAVTKGSLALDGARNLTWTDPFYEKDETVVAVFDMDYNTIEQTLIAKKNTLVLFVIFSSVASIMGLAALVEQGLFWLVIPLTPVVVLVIQRAIQRAIETNKAMLVLLRRHVAITLDGVYLDDSDEPGSMRLVRRSTVALKDVKSCVVNDIGWSTPSYQAVITYKGTIGTPPRTTTLVRQLRGLIVPQAFVDLVLQLTTQQSRAEMEHCNANDLAAPEMV